MPRSLVEFLTSAFTPEELRLFIRVLPEGEQLVRALPLGGTPHLFASEVVQALRRHGSLNHEFFTRLAHQRPRLAAEIHQLAAANGVPQEVPGHARAAAVPGERACLILVRAGDGLEPAQNLQRDLIRLLPELDVQILRVAEWSAEFAQPPTVACAVLFTREFMQSPRRDPLLREILEQHRLGALRALPVLVASTRWRATPFGRLPPLPSNSVPVEEWNDPNTAWAEVIRDLVRALPRPTADTPPPEVDVDELSFAGDGRAAPARGAAHDRAPPAPSTVPLRVQQVFRTTGVPDVSFVAPAQLRDLEIRVGFMNEGLVVEGPSGIGKTTATRHALVASLGADLDTLRSTDRLRWLSSKDDRDVAALVHLLDAGYADLRGHLVIDDFHRLDGALQGRVADLIKLVADSDTVSAKIIVIGINPVGSSLVQDFPDVAGRFFVVAMGKQPDEKIEELIRKGERALNITFGERDQFVRAARGSFFTAQLLCLQAALQDGILETSAEPRTIVSGPDGAILDRVHSQLKFKYHDALLAFAAYDVAPPPRGACLVLLWLLANSADTTVSLAAARVRYPELADAITWLLASNLSTLFARQPRLVQLFFYNRDAAILSTEDPQLEFYLANLNWPALARDSGHAAMAWDPEQGFRPATRAPTASTSIHATSAQPDLPRSRILHLSDLHLDGQRHAVQWYDQLREDLHSEGRDSLDAVLVSGDISNRAVAEEFEAAAQFLRDLQSDFKLSPQQIVLVPGNHDLNWTLSKQAFRVFRREDVTDPLRPGQFIDKGEFVEIPDDARHRERFRPFADFYYAVNMQPYPLDYEYQATIHHFARPRLLVLGLNSAWSLDHHFRDRADIHDVALGRALRQIQQQPDYADCLKLAVWHHPVSSPDPDRLRDTGFIERLAQAGFRLGLHGHVHRPQQGLFRYDMSVAGRRIDLIGAGTFGAPTHEWQPGYPLQYQILEFEGRTLRVESRRREELNGAWKPDARFTQGPGQAPRTYYEVAL